MGAKRARINRGSHPEESNLCVENKVNSIGGNETVPGDK